MARKRRRSIGDMIVLLVIVAALVWVFAPGVGWDLLGLRSRLGWPPLRSGQALSSLPDSELSERSTRICRTAMPTATTDPTATQQVTHFFMMILRFRSPADGGPRWARTTDLSLIRTAL